MIEKNKTEQKKKRGRIDPSVPHIDFSGRTKSRQDSSPIIGRKGSGKTSLLNWQYGTDDFKLFAEEAEAELTDEDQNLLRELQLTHGLVDSVAWRFKQFFALNLQELRQGKIDTNKPEVVQYLAIKSFREMEDNEIEVNRSSRVDNNFLSRFKLEDFEQKPTQRRVAEGVTNERSDPMSEESKLDKSQLAPIFEGELDRDSMAAALSAAMKEQGLSQRKAAALANAGKLDIVRIGKGEATLDKAAEVLSNLGYELHFEVRKADPSPE